MQDRIENFQFLEIYFKSLIKLKNLYSSHSDSKEMETFVKAVFPKKLAFHSHPNTAQSKQFRTQLQQKYTRNYVRASVKESDLIKRLNYKKGDI